MFEHVRHSLANHDRREFRHVRIAERVDGCRHVDAELFAQVLGSHELVVEVLDRRTGRKTRQLRRPLLDEIGKVVELSSYLAIVSRQQRKCTINLYGRASEGITEHLGELSVKPKALLVYLLVCQQLLRLMELSCGRVGALEHADDEGDQQPVSGRGRCSPELCAACGPAETDNDRKACDHVQESAYRLDHDDHARADDEGDALRRIRAGVDADSGQHHAVDQTRAVRDAMTKPQPNAERTG